MMPTACFFFFQAEDGIRDVAVTGVQTCALPICSRIADFDAVWEASWKENLFEAAIARVKKKIEPKQFQIFDCYVRKEWPAQKVAERLRVNVGQVYLARHRVSALLKKEIRALEKIESHAPL